MTVSDSQGTSIRSVCGEVLTKVIDGLRQTNSKETYSLGIPPPSNGHIFVREDFGCSPLDAISLQANLRPVIQALC